MVNVTGAKPQVAGGARDLFFEETSTVLVFKDGAVIRLAAPVEVGQLLFLTNRKSNQEVVCQVLRTRSFKQDSVFVELQFTEARTDYWGVAFPEEKRGGAEFRAVEHVQAEATTAERVDAPVAPHSAEDVNQLKEEVEALRDQLVVLEKKNVEEVAAKAMADAAAERDKAAREAAMREASKAVEAVVANARPAGDAGASAGAPGSGMNLKEELAPVNEPGAVAAKVLALVGEEKPELLMPPAPPKDENEVARAVVGMSLPVWRMEKTPEEQLLEEEAAAANTRPVQEPVVAAEAAVESASEELLPEPALDFTQGAKGKRAKAKKSVASVGAGAGSGKVRTIGLSALLVLAVVGGAWYGKWWQYLPGKKAAAVSVKAGARKTGNGATLPSSGQALPVSGQASGTPAGSGQTAAATSGTNGATVDSGKDAKHDVGTAALPSSGQALSTSGQATSGRGTSDSVAVKAGSSEAAGAAPVAEKKPGLRERIFGKKSQPKVEDASKTAVEATVPADAPVLPAKLVKAVNPVYPPEAMRSYITGDIKAEVEVLASGRVGDVKVISGPKALREAAVEALKQYEYAPATQGGKAVESKAEAVVKFWFNP